jgi:hypothetical protein
MAQRNILDDTILQVPILPNSRNELQGARKFADYKADIHLALTTASHLFPIN